MFQGVPMLPIVREWMQTRKEAAPAWDAARCFRWSEAWSTWLCRPSNRRQGRSIRPNHAGETGATWTRQGKCIMDAPRDSRFHAKTSISNILTTRYQYFDARESHTDGLPRARFDPAVTEKATRRSKVDHRDLILGLRRKSKASKSALLVLVPRPI